MNGVAAQTATPETDEEPLIAYEIFPKGGRFGSYFEPSIDAGETKKLDVVLANTGNVVFEGRTYAVNAFTEVNGGFAVAESDVAPEGVTLWLDYPEQTYTIPPGQGIERTFTVTVPEDVTPGQYITSLILENAEARDVEGSDNFEQVVRFAVPVFITVPGPVKPEFEIGEIALTAQESFAEITVQISNTGNVRVRPEGTITIADSAGEALFNTQVTMGSVFARDATTFQVGLPPLAPGQYQIAVDLKDPETKASASGTATVTVTAPATPVPPLPVQFIQATGTPRPDAENVQFLEIAATLDNTGEPLTNVQVVLHVTRDGEPVEDFAIASSLAVPQGQTPIQARYIPLTGWEPGTWQFTLSVEAVEGGVAQVITTVELDDVVIAGSDAG
jgi:hypothetical protein